MKIVEYNKQIQFHTENTVLRYELDEPIEVASDKDKVKDVYLMVTWSQQLDYKYLEDICILNDVANYTVWKDFPGNWEEMKVNIMKWLQKKGISFEKTKLDR